MAARAALPRCLAVWSAASLVAALACVGLAPAASSLPAAAGAPATADFADALVALCAAVALVAVAWLWALTGVVVLEAARGRAGRSRGVPGVVRRIVLAACGVALTGGLSLGAAAATPGHPHQDLAPESALPGLPLPDRAVAPAAPDRGTATGTGTGTGTGVVVVRRGDTLWAIAARGLGPDATPADVAARWRAIHRLNRSAIGADPDLIRPGQHLRLPHS